MIIKGKVEAFTPTTVSGWLAVFDKPDDTLRLQLILDEVSLAVAQVKGLRPDVAALGFERTRQVGHRDGGRRLHARQRVRKEGHGVLQNARPASVPIPKFAQFCRTIDANFGIGGH